MLVKWPDSTIQSLIALNQQLQLAQISNEDNMPDTKLETMRQMVEQMIDDLRRLTRDLRPIYLDDLELLPTLKMLARDMSQMQNPVSFESSGRERRLSAGEEMALYRIAQEGLNNVLRHAKATQASLCLAFGTEATTLTIRDDGVGFVAPESPAEMAATGHYGLLGIQERAEIVGARMAIVSAPGTGTEIKIHVPVGQDLTS